VICRCDHLQHVEITAIVDLLERKSHCTKQDLYDINTEFLRTNPRLILAARYADYGTVSGLTRWYKEEGT
jgi:hypothetical protein